MYCLASLRTCTCIYQFVIQTYMYVQMIMCTHTCVRWSLVSQASQLFWRVAAEWNWEAWERGYVRCVYPLTQAQLTEELHTVQEQNAHLRETLDLREWVGTVLGMTVYSRTVLYTCTYTVRACIPSDLKIYSRGTWTWHSLSHLVIQVHVYTPFACTIFSRVIAPLRVSAHPRFLAVNFKRTCALNREITVYV